MHTPPLGASADASPRVAAIAKRRAEEQQAEELLNSATVEMLTARALVGNRRADRLQLELDLEREHRASAEAERDALRARVGAALEWDHTQAHDRGKP